MTEKSGWAILHNLRRLFIKDTIWFIYTNLKRQYDSKELFEMCSSYEAPDNEIKYWYYFIKDAYGHIYEYPMVSQEKKVIGNTYEFNSTKKFYNFLRIKVNKEPVKPKTPVTPFTLNGSTIVNGTSGQIYNNFNDQQKLTIETNLIDTNTHRDYLRFKLTLAERFLISYILNKICKSLHRVVSENDAKQLATIYNREIEDLSAFRETWLQKKVHDEDKMLHDLWNQYDMLFKLRVKNTLNE